MTLLDVRKVIGSSPISSTNKKTCFVYLTKQVFLNDVCLTANDVVCANDVSFGKMSLR